MLKDLEPIASKLKEARMILNRALDSVNEEQSAAIMVTPEWSVKDVAAHLAGAERGMLGIAQKSARGENPQLPDGYNNDTFNARQVGKRKEQSLAQVRAELDATLAEMMTFLDAVTPEQLDQPGEHPLYGQVKLKELLVIIYSHETNHCKEISNAIYESKK